MEEITKGLFALQDETYRKFHAKLMPEIEFERIIGVRTPALRRYAKEIARRNISKNFLRSCRTVIMRKTIFTALS